MNNVEPPRMLSGNDCEAFPPEEFSPVTNGWRVGDRRTNTIVCAGGAGPDNPRSEGEFVILRSNDVYGRQGLDAVYVHGSGPVKITKAPMGRKVVTSAQKHGDIEFAGENGVTGTLHLKNDTVTPHG